MINFDEEIKKFHPSLEINDVENAIYNQDMKDMVDVMLRMTKDGVYGAESSPAHAAASHTMGMM
jgi:predicted transcriptional regulator